MAPPRACPTCGRLTTGGPCPEHARARDRARGSAQARGYDHEWADYSKRWLARFPWCGQRLDSRFHAEHSRCVQQGLRTKALVTDHIVSLRDGGARLDPANSQSLCNACNVAKSLNQTDL